MERLRVEAPDLLTSVNEEAMTLDQAMDVLAERHTERAKILDAAARAILNLRGIPSWLSSIGHADAVGLKVEISAFDWDYLPKIFESMKELEEYMRSGVVARTEA